MGFKDWLLLEDGFDDSGSDWFYGSVLRPSDAGDWHYAWPHPADFVFLQSRWDMERDEGRKFHGLDLDDVLATKFISLRSETMPDAGEGHWKHSNKERPNVTVHKTDKLDLHGFRGKSKQINKLTISNNLLDKKAELNRIFGDFKPKYPTVPDNMDEPWVHNETIAPFMVIGPGPGNHNNNAKMGIPSHLLGPDETGEKEQDQHVKTADFGFSKRKRRWKKINNVS